MKIRIHTAARNDLIDGYYFYENSEPGIGDYFLTSLCSDIDSLKIFAGIHRKAYKNLHRALSRKFPFAIYYTMQEEEVVVKAVLDCRKNPSWIRNRIKNT